MGRKPKVSCELKLGAVMKYLNNEGSYETIASMYDINWTTLRAWVKNYQALGADGLRAKSTNKHYSASFKVQVINSYLNGEGSFIDLSKKYKIPSKRTIMNWF
ncbi:helix-turn-helix domain-containing protein [Wukongibacter sp. M2B1]|uniref:helix-turn-helix domain-containing protein n=1 Tax=Wukongibacter sp. M2B1 TaxID=3088895 RepID=UPI003D79305C